MAIHLVGTIGYPILTVSLPDLFSPLLCIFSFLWYRTAPTRQVFCQLQRFLKRTIEICLHGALAPRLYLTPEGSDVRFGSKADIAVRPINVRFASKSRHPPVAQKERDRHNGRSPNCPH
jgi:hypothetical protein